MKQISIITLLLFFICFPGQAQNLQEIKKLYSEGKYRQAKPGVEQLLKTSPTNASYNQWYGVCLFETGELNASEKYLKIAAGKGVQESYRYLGYLYYQQYNFNESVNAYEKYLESLSKKKDSKEAEEIEPLLELSKRARRMLSHTEDIQIIDSVIVDKARFLSYYKLGEESGSIESKDNGKAITYTNQLANKRYYSKLANDTTYKLFSQTKLMDKWSDETMLSKEINDDTDNNYPFVLSDGVTVYFASKGHGSIGGYDLFITRYNNTNDTYLSPEQLGMPFNSIDNDYMLAIDDLNGVGYFTTDRFQPEGKVVIYTFIPNPERASINTENADTLKSRAMITSIRESWKKGKDYDAILQQLHNHAAGPVKETKKDFLFVINDNILYHSLDDFESDAAKDVFTEAQQLKKEWDALEKTLEENRTKYSKASADTKKAMNDTILDCENTMGKIQEKYEKLIISARNTEIKYLRQQNK